MKYTIFLLALFLPVLAYAEKDSNSTALKQEIIQHETDFIKKHGVTDVMDIDAILDATYKSKTQQESKEEKENE
ncbi:hypothetical protein [Pseudodesulfovibrio senegalensis]|uniref:Uncharacterized protein n=1 Tax=Pseudodesulfovibrio senegalensis TaxID=1721087 RepID=A0A6N6MYY8_9BACT|nr:hypothetical protein [Pseudodesulfovibrio senegalensis]KAB1437300.1 hypothetical protein F8A88_15350 [Pseudodesulfovibrio senegalensis]